MKKVILFDWGGVVANHENNLKEIKDAYSLGTPYILIIGNKFDKEKLEIEETKTGEKMYLSFKELVNLINN